MGEKDGGAVRAASFMEMLFIDSDGLAQKTGLGRALDTAAATWAEFCRHRKHGVDIKRATFLLDYHNRRGDLSDTIALDARGFTAVTGQAPKSEAAYRKIDRAYWAKARSTPTETKE
jgi:hypothetical protein